MKVRNWDKWQTFRKDRGAPPWIKVHRNLHSNQDWAQLSDAEKGQLISMWLLAADKNGELPDDAQMIQKMCMLDTPPNLNKFIELGFMLSHGCHLGASVAPDGRQDDAPEQSRGEQRRGDIRRFRAPTQKEVAKYMKERGCNVLAESEKFIDFYECKGWMVGKNKMKDWKAAARNWLKNVKLNHNVVQMSDVELINKAQELNIRTQGASRESLIRQINEKQA